MTGNWRSIGNNTLTSLLAAGVSLFALILPLGTSGKAALPTALVAVPAALLFAYIAVRSALRRVTATSSGLTVHEIWRHRTFEWPDIEEIACQLVDYRFIVSIYAPVVTLRRNQGTPDGHASRVTLRQLAVYSTKPQASKTVVGRRAREMNLTRAAHQSGSASDRGPFTPPSPK